MTDGKKINIVLAGQGNAGKSTVFNYLTGLHQHVGNWAGKTIEKREGTLYYIVILSMCLICPAFIP